MRICAFLLNLFLFPVAEFWLPCSNTGINLPIHNLVYPYLKKKTISTAVWTITDWSWISLLFIFWIIFCFKISRQFSPASVAAKYYKINTCATSLVILCYFPTTVHFHRFGILTFWIVYKYKLVFCCLTSFIKLKMSNSKDLQVDSCRILHRTFLHCDIFFLFFVSYLKSY